MLWVILVEWVGQGGRNPLFLRSILFNRDIWLDLLCTTSLICPWCHHLSSTIQTIIFILRLKYCLNEYYTFLIHNSNYSSLHICSLRYCQMGLNCSFKQRSILKIFLFKKYTLNSFLRLAN